MNRHWPIVAGDDKPLVEPLRPSPPAIPYLREAPSRSVQYARAHAEVVPGDYVMVAVSDTGHGMTADVVARVFEPSFTTKTEGRGTGLGLSMVFGFVKQSGGHVKIYSEPGEGTSVKIYLPRAVGAVLPSGQRSGVPADLPHGSATILVVEDEAGVREIAVAILRSLGYRVLEAPDGDEGLLVFGAHAAEVDMLLTNVVLPGKVRGRELAERITAMRRRCGCCSCPDILRTRSCITPAG